MGGFSAQVQSPQSQQTGNVNGIKGISQQDDQEDNIQKLLTGLAGGKVTFPGQQGQPQMGMPNAYENTVQPYNQQQPMPSTGKGNATNNQYAQQATGKGV